MTPTHSSSASTLILTGPGGPSSLVARKWILAELEAHAPPVQQVQYSDTASLPSELSAPLSLLATGTRSTVLIDLCGAVLTAKEAGARLLPLLQQAQLVLWVNESLPTPSPLRRLPDRTWLLQHGIRHSVLCGTDGDAIRRLLPALRPDAPPSTPARAPWRHLCGRCGDPDCERRLFPR